MNIPSHSATARLARLAEAARHGLIRGFSLLFVFAAASLTQVVASSTGSTGGNTPVETSNPNIALHWVICTTGVFPSRDYDPYFGADDEPFIGEIRCVAFDPAVGSFPSKFLPCDGRLIQISSNPNLFSLLGTYYGGDGSTTFALPDLRGRVPVGFDSGGSQFPLGEMGGQETVTLTTSQLPAHTHTVTGGTTGVTGGSQAFPNRQPYLALNHCIQGGGVFQSIGWIRVFAFNFAPPGFYPCNGGTEAIENNEVLFNQLGTNFGGNGDTTFGLPDLRGKSIVGTGTGPGLTARQFGETGGSGSLTLATANLPPHTHTIPGGSTGSSGGGTILGSFQPYLAISAKIATVGLFRSITDSPSIGEIRFFANSNTPGGFVDCNAAQRLISENNAMFSLLGTTFGGNGTTVFNVPDLRGRRCVGTGAGPGISARTLGQKWGVETISLTTAQMPAHVHSLPDAYATWAGAKGLTGAAGFENGKTDDPDKDGQNNLAEFAFDGNPLSANNDGKVVGRIATVGADEVLTLTLPVRNLASFPAGAGDRVSDPIDGVIYRIEGDVDLSTFADSISEVTPALSAGLPALSTGWAYRTFRAPGTVPTVPKAFLRAEISQAP